MNKEEKAKAYDEAIKKAKKDLQICEQDCLVAKQIFRYFPELAKPEDEKVRKEIIAVFKGETSYTSEEDAKRYIAWLESLKPQTPWKPTASQMSQLKWIAHQNADNMIGKELISLYQDLKKLREE